MKRKPIKVNNTEFLVILNISNLKGRSDALVEDLEHLIECSQYQFVLIDSGFSFDILNKLNKKIYLESYVVTGRMRSFYIDGKKEVSDMDSPLKIVETIRSIDNRKFLYIGPNDDLGKAFKKEGNGHMKFVATLAKPIREKLKILH